MMIMMVSKVAGVLEAVEVAVAVAEAEAAAEEDVAVAVADPTTTVAVVVAIARAKLTNPTDSNNSLTTPTRILGIGQQITTLVVVAQAQLAPRVAAAIIGTTRPVVPQTAPADPTTTTKSSVATTSKTVPKSLPATSNAKCKTTPCTDVDSDN